MVDGVMAQVFNSHVADEEKIIRKINRIRRHAAKHDGAVLIGLANQSTIFNLSDWNAVNELVNHAGEACLVRGAEQSYGLLTCSKP